MKVRRQEGNEQLAIFDRSRAEPAPVFPQKFATARWTTVSAVPRTMALRRNDSDAGGVATKGLLQESTREAPIAQDGS